ncbi:MAG: MipA/OmpV family protein [Gallionella sp.]
MNLHKHTLLVAIICAAFPALATAAGGYNDGNENVVEQTLPDAGWSMGSARVTLGMGLVDATRYVGSNERRVRLMPLLNATWGNGWFAGFPRGVGYNFSTDPRLEYGLRLGIDMGRRENVSPALNGLGDINPRLEPGGFVNYSLTQRLRLTTGLRYGSGRDSQGELLDMGLHYTQPLAENQSLTLGVATTYANSNYMQSFYGVTAAQSATSGYKVYTPGAGMREMDLSASYRYKIDRQWSLLTGATLGKLGSSVTAAPMTLSNAHNSVYVQTNYTF